MILLDGTFGEGGGQILRTALSLSTITGKDFKIINIRKGRKKPGLKTQHVYCVKALKDLTGAKAIDAELGSYSMSFFPGKEFKRSIDIDFGTAGSITLFLQSILKPIFFSKHSVKLNITGGTDVSWSVPIDFLREVIVPQLRRFCKNISISTVKRGYFPKGEGNIQVKVFPKEEKGTLNLVERGELIKIKGISHASNHLQDANVADRQAASARSQLKKLNIPVDINVEYSDTLSKGSVITLWAIFSLDGEEIDFFNPIILGSDVLGEKGKSSELVGEEAAKKLIELINTGAPLDEHTADNLIPWMGLFKPSKIRVSQITNHIKSNIYVTEKFLDVKFKIEGNIISCE